MGVEMTRSTKAPAGVLQPYLPLTVENYVERRLRRPRLNSSMRFALPVQAPAPLPFQMAASTWHLALGPRTCS